MTEMNAGPVSPAAPPKPSRARKFWRVLPWALLVLIGLLFAVRSINKAWALHVGMEEINSRLGGGEDAFQALDYWKNGDACEVALFRTTGRLFGEAYCLHIEVGEGLTLLVKSDAKTRKIRSVSLHRKADKAILMSAGAPDDVGIAFPKSFSIIAQDGPDAGYSLEDINADGKWDFKIQMWTSEYYKWEDGKGWLRAPAADPTETSPEPAQPPPATVR